MIDVNNSLTTAQILFLVLVVIWDTTWKILAAWKAAKNNNRLAFVALLFINSIGIIPILYLAYNKYGKTDKKKLNSTPQKNSAPTKLEALKQLH